MNTSRHEWFMEPRKARNTRKEECEKKLSRLSRLSRLKNNSALSIHHSELGEAVWEIQR